jgi:enoyl-CoA hydratase/carnithine racemase
VSAGPRLLSLDEAVELARAPDAPERWGPFGEAPLFAVELGDAGASLPGAADALRARLVRLPCPTAALVRAGVRSPLAQRWATAFDLVLEDEAALGQVARAAAHAPLAAAILVQLLRLRAWRDVEAGLAAESLAYATLQAGPEFAAWLRARPARASGSATPPLAPPVLVRREGPRLHLTLNRPERRNAYSASMRDALCEALALAAQDATLDAIVLDGAGAAFSSGGDLDEFGTLPDPATAHAVRSTRSAARALAACADRVRAELHGACLGAGVELAAFAGRVVARPDAFFALPELAMGLVPGAGGTVSLPRRIGPHRTAWLALSGDRIDAATARDWGLVDEIREWKETN